MSTKPPSIFNLILLYAAIYIGLTALMFVLIWALERFGGFQVELTSAGWVPVIVAALQTGQHYGTKTKSLPPKRTAWIAALGFTAVNLALGLVAFFVVISVASTPITDASSGLSQYAIGADDLPFVVGAFAVLALLMWVGLRFAFSFGAKQGVRIAAKTGAS